MDTDREVARLSIGDLHARGWGPKPPSATEHAYLRLHGYERWAAWKRRYEARRAAAQRDLARRSATAVNETAAALGSPVRFYTGTPPRPGAVLVRFTSCAP